MECTQCDVATIFTTVLRSMATTTSSSENIFGFTMRISGACTRPDSRVCVCFRLFCFAFNVFRFAWVDRYAGLREHNANWSYFTVLRPHSLLKKKIYLIYSFHQRTHSKSKPTCLQRDFIPLQWQRSHAAQRTWAFGEGGTWFSTVPSATLTFETTHHGGCDRVCLFVILFYFFPIRSEIGKDMILWTSEQRAEVFHLVYV